ncbi:MAG: hypothetical protein IPJ58_17655 [Ardenticatenia bacterium]|nr:hypothetical protein [Ardenticatenia bacterium]
MDPGRAACSAITGYLYQAAWGVLRWLDLADDQVLLCAGRRRPGPAAAR